MKHQLLTTTTTCTKKNIIFDFGGVLFHPSKKYILAKIGWTRMALYALRHLKSPYKLFDKLTDFLTIISPPASDRYKHQETVFPEIICQWLRGQASSQEILSDIARALEECDKKNYFASPLEKKLIGQITTLLFSPEALCNNSFQPIPEGIAALHAYHNKVDAQGNKVHKLYLLSNLDKETVPLLAKKYPELFACFDQMITSANVGVMKPDQEIYEYLLTTYHLDPKECLFIDDQIENIIAAEKCGITGIQFII